MAESTSVEAVQVPWEAHVGSLIRRYLGTLAQAVQPIRSAPAFAGQTTAPAVRFALLSALPLAALSGIIPYTRTLLFEPGFRLSLIDTPSGGLIAVDLLRAAGISMLVCSALFMALALPYISLVRAYGLPEARQVAPRLMLYRAWLVPLAMLIAAGSYFAVPANTTIEDIQKIGGFGMMLPHLLLFLAMRHTASRIAGVPGFMSFVVVVLPFVLLELIRALPVLGVPT